jgi:hypothetical protein
MDPNAAALYRQRAAQSSGRPMPGGPPRHPPQGSRAAAQQQRRPMSNARLTGSNPRIPRGMDPTDKQSVMNREKMEGDEAKIAGTLEGVHRIVIGVVLAIALSATFIMPRQLKTFWVLLMGLTIMMCLGFTLYKEWMQRSKSGEEGADKYSDWAGVLLYALVMLYTAVMVGTLFFFAWSLYSIANSQSNLGRQDGPAAVDKRDAEVNEKYGGVEEDFGGAETVVSHRRSSKKHKRRHRH